jgi:hypothetical protein
VNTFFGEQLVEPGGAMSIDSSGLGPLLPIGEAPPNLEHQLDETPHEVLEAAIAEDDQKYKETGGTRYYELAPDEVFTTDGPGESAFRQLRQSPSALQHAVEGSVEERLLRASQP